MMMTIDQLDQIGHAAAVHLRNQVHEISTDAALVELRSLSSGRQRWVPTRPGWRSLVAAAAAVVVLAGLAVAAMWTGGDDPQRVGTVPGTVDPTSYGPILGSLEGEDGSDLRATVYGPTALDDRDQIAVSVSGGAPGQRYQIAQCATGDETFNPAANCGPGLPLTVGPDGNGVAVVEAWTVFDGTAVPFRNDCRMVSCELQIAPVIGDDQPDEGLAGTRFSEKPIPLSFATDAGAPPLPAITVTELGHNEQGTQVRLEGSHLVPGPSQVLAFGWTSPPVGVMTHVPGIGPAEVAMVVVAADGSLSAIVTLPDTIVDAATQEAATCDQVPGYCEVRVASTVGGATGAGRPALSAPPIRYPDQP